MGAIECIGNWSGWQWFALVNPAESAQSIFGFSDFLTALALLLVVMTTSDFRYRYRINTARWNWSRAGFWVSVCIGIGILLADIWYQNDLLVPKFIADLNNVKAGLGLLFLAFTFRALWIAFFRPPIFSRWNAKRFYDYHSHLLSEGKPEQLAVIAEDLRRSMAGIIEYASKIPRRDRHQKMDLEVPHVQAFAHYFLLLIAEPRFCRIIVNSVPTFALVTFLEGQKYVEKNLPIFQFARNVGQEFIRNTDSLFYQEDSGYYSGMVGYHAHVTKIVFGHFEFVERCATDGASPLETDYVEFHEFGALQMAGYCRAAEAFAESYFRATGGNRHSYAFTRLMHSFEGVYSSLYRINGASDLSASPDYQRLEAIFRFLKETINLAEEHLEKPQSVKIGDSVFPGVHDVIAKAIVDAALSSGSIQGPVWTTWQVQHNIIWNVFSFGDTAAHKMIAAKVRRLLFDQIKEMDRWPNFQGARALGFCLNVLGLTPVDRHKGFRREFCPLQYQVLKWTRANYARLLLDHPKVAEACMQGGVTYDPEGHRLVKVFNNDTGKEPPREFLILDRLEASEPTKKQTRRTRLRRAATASTPASE